MSNNILKLSEPPKIITQSSHIFQSTYQCDACSPILAAKKQTYQFNFEECNFHKNKELISYRINSDNYAVVSPLANTFTVLNYSAKKILDIFDDDSANNYVLTQFYNKWGINIINKILDQMVISGLLIDNSKKNYMFKEKLEKLAAWLHITDRCNLRCTYCYLQHKKADMSEEIGRAAIEATFRSAIIHNYKEVKFKYAGGEPLLRFLLIEKLHKVAKLFAERYDIELDEVILSNGTLLNTKIIKTILKLGLRIMISLDGLGPYHNNQRPYANGLGSVDDVLNAINLSLSYGLVPDISITVTGQNAEGLPQLMEWILERNLPFSINFFRDNGNSRHYQNLKLEEKKIITGLLAAYKVIEDNLPKHSMLASLADRANLSTLHLRTCSVGRSYLVFDPLGLVSKCQMKMDRAITNVNAVDPLTVVRADKKGIRNISFEKKEECRTCVWRYWCSGGCPLAAYNATGRYDIKSPDCNIYKAIYPEIIRLEGLRLLRYFNTN